MSKKVGIVKKFVHLAEYGALLVFSALFMILPDSWVYAIAGKLGAFAFDILKIRRDVTLDNLRHALGDSKTEAELQRIARDTYINIGMAFIEMLIVPKFKHRFFDMVDISDGDIMWRNLEKGRGLILVSCHFGSWELTGSSVAMYGVPVTVVGKRQSNPYADAFITRLRTGMGMEMVTPGASIKHIVRTLRKGGAVGLISDQNAGQSGVFVDFFGRKASTPGGAAQLALKYGSPIFTIMALRIKPGQYKILFREIEVVDGDTVESITQRFTTAMEKIIAAHPEQYFWMHNRWKTRPPDENTGESSVTGGSIPVAEA